MSFFKKGYDMKCSTSRRFTCTRVAEIVARMSINLYTNKISKVNATDKVLVKWITTGHKQTDRAEGGIPPWTSSRRNCLGEESSHKGIPL